MSKEKGMKKEKDYVKGGAFIGLTLFLAGALGGPIYDSYTALHKHRNPSPIAKRCEKLRKDEDVILYYELKNKPLSCLEETPTTSEIFKSLLDDPELLEYKKLSKEVNKNHYRDSLLGTKYGTSIGSLCLMVSALSGMYAERRKRKKQKLEEEK